LLPLSGLERSGFVLWPEAAEIWCCRKSKAIWGTPAVALMRSEHDICTERTRDDSVASHKVRIDQAKLQSG